MPDKLSCAMQTSFLSFVSFLRTLFQTRTALHLENLALRHQVNVLHRAQRGQHPTELSGLPVLGLALQNMVRLAVSFGDRQARNCDRLAPEGLSPVLGMEEQTLPRQTGSFRRSSRSDP